MLSHWEDGIHPGFRDAAIAVVAEDEVKLHDFAAALTSSQMFALNLFIPWRSGVRTGLENLVGRALGERVSLERVALEWVPPGALLGEIDGDRPREDEPATGVDVVLWGLDETGARIAVLVEVKLGEGGFTACGGRESKGNRRKDVCASAETFFRDPSACYLQHPRGKARDRRYWEIFARSHGSVRAAFPGAQAVGGCPFAGQAQQPMRNLALAEALVQGHVVSRSWFALCAHDHNPDVAGHWAAWRSLLPASVPAPVMRASDVVAAGRADGHGEWADWMTERYRLGSP
ncbi:MAG: hypothetical protein IV100_23440 [Myxococcales bacterium]|nr:hypothetical protein [Myxococcales bacterium]